MKMFAFRIEPGQDLKLELERVIKDEDITSGFIATAVGSLHEVVIRMAGARPESQDIRNLSGHYEIVSLVGTLSQEGAHVHVSVSDSEGRVIGGHLKEGSLVTTTAEIIIAYDDDVTFKRKLDPMTGFDELSVS